MDDKTEAKIKKIFKVELSKLELIQTSAEKWQQLERLHVIGQLVMSLHFSVHFLMLNLALKEGKRSEIFGQALRIVLVIPGHLFGRLPIGNVGTSRVNAFKTMPIPENLIGFVESSSTKNEES